MTTTDEMAGMPLPYTRDVLGRFVREAWVRWAQTQPNPKPSWLEPYDNLSEPDKEADRQIGETIARWTIAGCEAAGAIMEKMAALTAPAAPREDFVCLCCGGTGEMRFERVKHPCPYCALPHPRPGAEGAEPVAFDQEARADLLGIIRAAAAANSSCTLTYPQVHTLQKLLMALVGDAKAPAGAGEAGVRELRDAVVNAALAWKQGLSKAGLAELDALEAALAAAEPRDIGGR